MKRKSAGLVTAARVQGAYTQDKVVNSSRRREELDGAEIGPKRAKNSGRKLARRPLRPFIPSWMFELGLSPIEFLVLSHLWRRADATNWCFPSGLDIERTCDISDDSVWKTLNSLEARGLFKRHRTGRRNDFQMLIPSSNLPGKCGDQNPEQTGELNPGKAGDQFPGAAGHQGNPLKADQLAVMTSQLVGPSSEEEPIEARGAQNPGAEAPDSAPAQSTTESGAERWTDWHGDDDGEPPPVGWAAPSGAPNWRDLAPWEQRGVMDGDADSIASSRRWSAVRSTDGEPGRPPPERWRERAAPYLRRSEHWRALTPVDQDGLFANLGPLPAESPAARPA